MLMIDFDARTSFFILGLLYLLLPVFSWFVLAKQRSIQVALWCGSGFLLGVSAILAGLAGHVPEWVSILLPALLFLFSSFARIQSLRMDLGIPWQWRWIALAAATFYLIYLGLHFGLQNYVLRAQFLFIVLAGLIFYLTLLALRIGREEQSHNAKWIAWIYMLVAVAMLFRVVNLVGSNGAVVIVNEGLSAKFLALIMLLAAVVGHFGYIGLHLDRSMRRELKAAAAQARDEESHRLGEQIALLDRSRSLGEMSASLGHELNQPLTAILTNAQVAQRGLQTGRFDGTQVSEFFEKIIHNTHRASLIIEKIRGFIRPSALTRVPLNLGKVIRESVELVAAEAAKRNIKLMIHAQTEPVSVMGDATHLTQVMVNILRNAIDALDQVAHRQIDITLRAVAGQAILTVCDSGPGLRPDVLDKVGTPFFTTKENGLGMGLSISRSILRQHDGELIMSNAAGAGACMDIRLPVLPHFPGVKT
jgi:signal transduction histidine kinase